MLNVMALVGAPLPWLIDDLHNELNHHFQVSGRLGSMCPSYKMFIMGIMGPGITKAQMISFALPRRNGMWAVRC